MQSTEMPTAPVWNQQCVQAILSYFSEQARTFGITYSVSASIPKHISISETDLSILFGNLLENAIDACNAQPGKDKKIIVRAKTDDHSLCVTIDNTFSGSLDIDQERHFVSSKHEGLGPFTNLASVFSNCSILIGLDK